MNETNKLLCLIEAFKTNTYQCEICRKIIFPQIITAGDGNYDIMATVASIHSGKGKKIIHNHVCPDCAKSLNNVEVKE